MPEAVVTADFLLIPSCFSPTGLLSPFSCVLIFSYSVATTQLPVSAPAHPHQIHSPLCPFPISQTTAVRGSDVLEINIKVFELNHLE